MAHHFREPERREVFLLPADMMDWLSEGDIVHLIVDAVAMMDLSAFEADDKLGRAGPAPFAPQVLLALLIYAYSHGVRSSRAIERLCGRDGGHPEKACEALGRIVSWAKDAIVLNEPAGEAGARRLVARCTELHACIETNEDALTDYGQRCRAGKPISTSRAEGTFNQLVNARMNKRRQMRWSPRGAHRVLQVRAAVLDGRFGQHAILLAA